MAAAIFGGGCFWCLDAPLRRVAGVREVLCGYAGGTTRNPTYAQVCTDTTGHAEVVRVEFDEARLSYRRLLEMFFSLHDPTSRSRQGHDVGTQYRSVIICLDDEQYSTASALIAELDAARRWPAPIVSEVRRETTFYRAEEEHQDYYSAHPGQAYCAVVIGPKLDEFRRQFAPELERL